MKILLAAKFSPNGRRPIGGVQSWGATVQKELESRGHNVEAWEPGLPEPQGRFEFGIFANMGSTQSVRGVCDKVFCVSHGIIPPEKPAMDADRTFFVSEGVRDHWGGDGDILRQPIDLDFWSPGTEPRKRQAVRFSYRHTETVCEDAARMLGLSFIHLHGAVPAVAQSVLRRSALVFATGRAALEAMACGAEVALYDHRIAYQGPLLGLDRQQQMENSYSGRGGVLNPTAAQLVSAARGLTHASSPRAWVRAHHNVTDIVDQLLQAM